MILKTATVCLAIVIITGILVAQDPQSKNDAPPDYKGPVVTGDRSVPKQISGGVLNGKAISLPKPPFPAAAKAVGASGVVTVQVLIDENGDVVSATAVSGHPLLRAAAAEAARGAKFSPTKLMGNPVKVSGVITYNFVGPLQPARLGFVIAFSERTSSFYNYVSPASLSYQLPPDWAREKEILNSLTFEDIPVSSAKPDMVKDVTTVAPANSSNTQPQDKNRYTVKGDLNYSGTASPHGRKLDSNSVASLRTLAEFVAERWSHNEALSWGNELGMYLGILVAEIDDESKFETNLAKLESMIERSPSTLNQSSLDRVRKFVELCKADARSDERKRGLITAAEMLSNLRY